MIFGVAEIIAWLSRTMTLVPGDKNVALVAAGGSLLAVMRATLDGRATKRAAEAHATCVLQMFGMTPDAAAEVASRPLPA